MALDDIRLSLTWRRHPKRVKLRRRLGAEGVLALEDLWAHVAETASLRTDGVLRNMAAEDIAIAAGWERDPDELVAALSSPDLRLLDQVTEDGHTWYAVHDWTEHQEHAAGYNQFVQKMRHLGSAGGKKSAAKRSGQPVRSSESVQHHAQAARSSDLVEQHGQPTGSTTYLPTNLPTDDVGVSRGTPSASTSWPWERFEAEVWTPIQEFWPKARLGDAWKAHDALQSNRRLRERDGPTIVQTLRNIHESFETDSWDVQRRPRIASIFSKPTDWWENYLPEVVGAKTAARTCEEPNCESPPEMMHRWCESHFMTRT